MKKLTIAVVAIIALSTGNAFAVKPLEFFSSVDQVSSEDKEVSYIDEILLSDGYIKQGCDLQNTYYLILPQNNEYISAKVNCSYYKLYQGNEFISTYANLKFNILYNKKKQEFRVDNTIDVTYTTVY